MIEADQRSDHTKPGFSGSFIIIILVISKTQYMLNKVALKLNTTLNKTKKRPQLSITHCDFTVYSRWREMKPICSILQIKDISSNYKDSRSSGISQKYLVVVF